LIVDNVFATPIWQSPLSLGADVVIYSATKHIDGQGRCLGGIILSSEAFIAEHIHNFMRQTGPSMSPFNAWVLLKGPGDAGRRVRAQTETAGKVAMRSPASEDLAADLSRAIGSSAGGAREEADARRLDADRLRGQGRQAGRVPLPSMRLQISRISNQSRRRQEPRHPSRTTTHQRLTPEARAELRQSARASFASRRGWSTWMI
jgi:O-succinylhomoserine sulfhydrylase